MVAHMFGIVLIGIKGFGAHIAQMGEFLWVPFFYVGVEQVFVTETKNRKRMNLILL